MDFAVHCTHTTSFKPTEIQDNMRRILTLILLILSLQPIFSAFSACNVKAEAYRKVCKKEFVVIQSI